MLQTLRVRNLAIVEDVRVEFGPHLNCITGETGAGKSILIGALALVLGERADRSLIRAGEEQCGVEATFELPDPAEVDAILEELGIEPCENGRLIVRRVFSASGSSRSLVNDSPATLQVLKRIGDLLVDMHGPHDHQSLLSQAFQLDILDSFGHLWKSRAAYEEVYAAMVELRRRREELDDAGIDVAGQIDLLSYQIKEIEDARMNPEEEEEVESEHKRVANAQQVTSLAGGIAEALIEGDNSAFSSLAAVQRALAEMAHAVDEAAEWQAEARSMAVQVQELADSISRFVQDIDADPERLQWLEDRKALIHKLKRKYGGSVSEALQFLAKARERLEGLETRGERIAELDARLKEAEERVKTAGQGLSEERGRIASSLSDSITSELRDLGFAHAAFDVALSPVVPGPSGMDEIDFGFAPNVGESMRPLRAIASSGEISRVMLAIKTVLAKHDRIPVLVFDEIDTNIGGEVANAVGSKLAGVAATHQVLCITHLPQVAVRGATHLVVAKGVADGRTRTGIRCVTGGERTEEIARMLGGKNLTSVTLRHAAEMLRGGL